MQNIPSPFVPFLIGTLALGVMAAPAAAFPGDRATDPGALVATIERHADELGVDDATLQAMRQLVADGRTAAEPLRRAVGDARATLAALLDADVIDADAVHAQIAVVSAAELALALQQVDIVIAVRALLTPEQLVLLRDIVARERTGPRPEPGRPRR